jgi:hypothetical protein
MSLEQAACDWINHPERATRFCHATLAPLGMRRRGERDFLIHCKTSIEARDRRDG